MSSDWDEFEAGKVQPSFFNGFKSDVPNIQPQLKTFYIQFAPKHNSFDLCVYLAEDNGCMD